MTRLMAVALALSLLLSATDVRAKSTTRVDVSGGNRSFAPHDQRGPSDDLSTPNIEIQEVPLGDVSNMTLNGAPTGEIIPYVDRDLSQSVGDTIIRDAVVTPRPTPQTNQAADATVRGAVQRVESNPNSTVGRFEQAIGIGKAGAQIDPNNLKKAFDNDLNAGVLKAMDPENGLPALARAEGFRPLHPLERLAASGSLALEPAKRAAIEEDPLAIKVPDVMQVLGDLKRNAIEDNPAFNEEIARRGISRDSAFLVREGAPELLFLFREGDLIQDGARGVARTFKSESQGLSLGPVLIVSASQAAKPEALRRAVNNAVVAVTPRQRTDYSSYALRPSPIVGVTPEIPSGFRRHALQRAGNQDQRQPNAVEQAKLTLRQAAVTVSSWVQKLSFFIFPPQHAAARAG